MYSLAFVSQQKTKFKPFCNALMDYPQLGEIHEAHSLWKFIPFIPTAIGDLDMVIIDLTHELTWDMTMSMVKFKMQYPNIELVALVDKTNINFIMSCINYGATGLLLWNPQQSQVLAATVFQALERKGTPLSPSLAKLLISQFQYSKNLESQRA
jgi:DNA-binding NarL/FixJ family response regulator